MTDLPEPIFLQTGRTLERSRATTARYLNLLDAQRAALRAEDLELLASLATEATEVLSALERGTRLPAELEQRLRQTEGPRSRAIRDLLATVRYETQVAGAGIQEFLESLGARREQLLRRLAALRQAGPGDGGPYPPLRLDRTG